MSAYAITGFLRTAYRLKNLEYCVVSPSAITFMRYDMRNLKRVRKSNA